MQTFTSEHLSNAFALLRRVVNPTSRTQEALDAAAMNLVIQAYGVILQSHGPFVDMAKTYAYWTMRANPQRDTIIDMNQARRCSFMDAFSSPTDQKRRARTNARPTDASRTLRCASSV